MFWQNLNMNLPNTFQTFFLFDDYTKILKTVTEHEIDIRRKPKLEERT